MKRKKEGNKNEKVETKSKNPIKLNLTKLDEKREKITKNKIKMKAKLKNVGFLLTKIFRMETLLSQILEFLSFARYGDMWVLVAV